MRVGRRLRLLTLFTVLSIRLAREFHGKEETIRMDEIFKLVGNFGFPIVVSAYLLVRIEGKLGELTQSITELAKAIAIIKV